MNKGFSLCQDTARNKEEEVDEGIRDRKRNYSLEIEEEYKID